MTFTAVDGSKLETTRCPVCQETDQRHMFFLQQVLGPNEGGIILAALGGLLQGLDAKLRGVNPMEQHETLKRQQEHATTAMGLIMMVYPPPARKALIDAMAQNGVQIRVEYKCEHTAEEKQVVIDHLKHEEEAKAAMAAKAPPSETM